MRLDSDLGDSGDGKWVNHDYNKIDQVASEICCQRELYWSQGTRNRIAGFEAIAAKRGCVVSVFTSSLIIQDMANEALRFRRPMTSQDVELPARIARIAEAK